MSNTYSQIFYHLIFAVRNRESLITSSIKSDLYKYISGIVTLQKQKLFIINGMPDHVHLLLNCKPDIRLSDLIKEIKEHSSKFINQKKTLMGKFYWQAGSGIFSVSKKEVSFVLNYIKNQEEHHREFDFQTEYIRLLKDHEIEFKKEYLFNFKELAIES